MPCSVSDDGFDYEDSLEKPDRLSDQCDSAYEAARDAELIESVARQQTLGIVSALFSRGEEHELALAHAKASLDALYGKNGAMKR